jgi:phospholipid/cholesterol/gamma-HCH transport system substrate-binding protein
MRTEHNRLEIFVGCLVLMVAFWFVYVSYGSSGQSFKDGYTLSAVFDRVDGLNIGSDVKVSGVKVGCVTGIDFDPKTYRAKVDFVIQKKIQVPLDSSASIASESLLGGKYLSLSAGYEKKMLKEFEVITETQSSLNIENLLGKFLFSGDKAQN